MAFTKITPDELAGKGVIGQPAVPGLSVEEMQKSVEQIVREVAIPGVNRLVDELGAETAAGNIGMPVPSTMPPETGATVKEIATAHIENKENPHGVTAAQVGAYTRQETDDAIDQKVQAIGAADMSKAEFATNGRPGIVDKAVTAETADSATAADDGVKVYTHSRSGTVNELTGDGPNGRALMTADVQPGDTWTVNGQPVTAYMGTEDATDSMAGQPYNGKWVTFVAEGTTLNFKGGGGKGVVDCGWIAWANILASTTFTSAIVPSASKGNSYDFNASANGFSTTYQNNALSVEVTKSGTYAINIFAFRAAGGTAFCQILKNGQPFFNSENTPVFPGYTGNIATSAQIIAQLSQGDVLTLQGRSSSGQDCVVHLSAVAAK